MITIFNAYKNQVVNQCSKSTRKGVLLNGGESEAVTVYLYNPPLSQQFIYWTVCTL